MKQVGITSCTCIDEHGVGHAIYPSLEIISIGLILR